MSFLLKDPGATLDYAVDWGADYLDNDVIAESRWAVVPAEPGGLLVLGASFDDKVATVTAAGGTAGRQYRLTNHVVTASGREDERSLVLRVEQR